VTEAAERGIAVPPSGHGVRISARLLVIRLTGGRLRDSWQYVVVPAVLIAVWEWAVDSHLLNEFLVPSPHLAAQSLWIWVFGSGHVLKSPYDATWTANAEASAVRVLMGFAIASAVGVTVGLLNGWYRLPRTLFQPIIDIVRPIPITAFVPFAVVFFGIQQTSAVFLIALGAFFPIALNAAAGAAGTPQVLVRAAQMLGTPERLLLWRVVLPSALPSIVSGLRVGLALSWVLVIVSEMVAVKSGLGFSLWNAYYFGRVDIIVAAMFSVGLLGFLSDRILVLVTGRIMAWAPDVR